MGDSRTLDGDATGGDDDRLYGGEGNDFIQADSEAFNSGNARGGGKDRIDAGPGDDLMTGDSFARIGSATGAGDDSISGGLGADGAFGDSNGCRLVAAGCTVSGDGGDDVIDLGPDSGLFAAGDHNTDQPGVSVTGAGNDEITGGPRSEFLIGDSFADVPSDAGDDEIEGGGGADFIFGDNTDFFGTGSIFTVGGEDELDGDAGNDFLRGGPADDELDGGADIDDCAGEGGNDSIEGCESG